MSKFAGFEFGVVLPGIEIDHFLAEPSIKGSRFVSRCHSESGFPEPSSANLLRRGMFFLLVEFLVRDL